MQKKVAAMSGDGETRARAAQRQELLDCVPSVDPDAMPSKKSLSQTRADLRKSALDIGHPQAEVDAWLADDFTTIELLGKDRLWTNELDDEEWTPRLASYCAYHFGSYSEIPEELHSHPLVGLAMRAFDVRLIQTMAQYEHLHSQSGSQAEKGGSSR